MSDQSKIEEVKGKAKETVGKLTGSDELAREGMQQQEKADKQEQAEALEEAAQEKKAEAAGHAAQEQRHQ